MTLHSVQGNVIEFSDKFFPLPSTTHRPRAQLNGNPFIGLENAGELPEASILHMFIAAINNRSLVPSMKLVYCGDRPDEAKANEDRQKVDTAFYHADDIPMNGCPGWGDQSIPVTFRSRETRQDPFDDNEDEVWEVDAATRHKVRGEIISYAELIFHIQQREALFMLLIIGRRCRFMRWDRSGTIVTAAMDYFVEWECFCEILWRVANLSDAQLGMDPSATRLYPGHPEFDQMDVAAEPHEEDIDHRERILDSEQLHDNQFKFIRDAFRKSLQPGWPRYKLEVPDADKVRYFLVAKPAFRARGLVGRGTRGYVALDTTTGRFVWLKDAWRVDCSGMKKEGDSLSQLNTARIPYVPTVVCHGDIRDQQTLTPVWWERKHRVGLSSLTTKSMKRKRRDDETEQSLTLMRSHGNHDEPPIREDCPLRVLRHYRLVVAEVCMPLHEFQYGRQLVGIIYDCLLAHEQAVMHPDTQLLHRDISAGNVLIYPRVVVEPGSIRLQWGGLLADWEMSTTIHQSRDGRLPERMGTWPYMSVALLSHDSSVHRIADELESFFHVILYHAARYLPSNCDDFTIASYIDGYFDTYGVDGTMYVCGDKKANTIKAGKLAVNDRKMLEFGSPMDNLFEEVLSWFRAHYAVTDYNRKLEQQLKESAHSEMQSPESASKDDAPSLPFALPSLPSATSQRRRRAVVQDNAPTEEDEAFASYVQVHQYMKDLFQEAFHDPRWRPERKRDRIPKGWTLYREDPKLDSVPSRGNKRRRLAVCPQTGTATSAPVLLTRPRQPVTPTKGRPAVQTMWTGR